MSRRLDQIPLAQDVAVMGILGFLAVYLTRLGKKLGR